LVITKKRINVLGVETGLIEAGDPANQTIVLIHDGGYGSTADLCWDATIELLQNDYHVIAPEMLGWGHTAKMVDFSRSPYDQRIDHLTETFEVLAIQDAIFIGVSFGGSIVLRAASDLSRPWPMKAAVSVAGSLGINRKPEGVAALTNYEPTLEDAKKLTSFLVDNVDDYMDHVHKRLENSMIPGHWEAVSAPVLKNPKAPKVEPDNEYPEALSQIKVPTLFIEGEKDKLLDPGWAEQFAKHTPNGIARVLDCGHEPNIDNPLLLVNTLKEFFCEVGL